MLGKIYYAIPDSFLSAHYYLEEGSWEGSRGLDYYEQLNYTPVDCLGLNFIKLYQLSCMLNDLYVIGMLDLFLLIRIPLLFLQIFLREIVNNRTGSFSLIRIVSKILLFLIRLITSFLFFLLSILFITYVFTAFHNILYVTHPLLFEHTLYIPDIYRSSRFLTTLWSIIVD